MNYRPLGELIQKVDLRNRDFSISNLLGVNINKQFMPSVANQSGLDLSKYKIIRKGVFATNLMHVNRDEVLPVALYEKEEPAIISPAYIMFEVVDRKIILPEYLMIEFQRPEFDRKAWTYCDSSVRGGLEWERLCEIKIPVPDIDEQRIYVAIYKALLANQKAYEKSLDDLQLICDTYIEDLIKTDKPKKLGDYIEKTEERNSEENNSKVMGMSTKKQYRKPQSRVNYKNLSNYRIVKKMEFSYVPTTDTWKVLAVAMSNYDYEIIVSPIYITFKVKNTEVLLPEYLNIFYKRNEFDRYARFHSWGSARENFNWEDMCDVSIPIPDIEKQKAIVAIYHTLEKRKKINEQLKNSIKPLCPVLMRGVVEEIEKQ
jgi:type I restriction enzyme S subunit